MEFRKRKPSWSSMHNTPPEIWRQILSYLPAKSLLRFRSVCRRWKRTIEEPDFAYLHLERCCSNTNIVETSLIVQEESQFSRNHWVLRCGETYEEKSTDHQIKFPFGSGGRWRCVGARDGLILLQRNPMRFASKDILLWNPSIRKCIFIPRVPFEPFCWFPSNVCFGFDPSCNDYKVVSFVNRSLPSTASPTFYVFSLRDWLWTEVRPPAQVSDYCDNRFLITCDYSLKLSIREYIHWTAKVFDTAGIKQGACLVSLNLTTLTLSYTPLSDKAWSLRYPSVKGSSFLGLLAKQEGFHKSCAESWSKMYDELDRGYYHIRKDGLILVLPTKEGSSYLYDPTTNQKKKKVLNSVKFKTLSINAHVESLILLSKSWSGNCY